MCHPILTVTLPPPIRPYPSFDIIGTAAGQVGIMALVAARCHPDVVGRTTALLEVAHAVGWAVGPPVAGLVYQSFGFAATFAGCAGLCVLAGGVATVVLATVPDTARAEEPPSLKTVVRAGPAVLPAVLAIVVFFAAQDLLFANITARAPLTLASIRSASPASPPPPPCAPPTWSAVRIVPCAGRRALRAPFWHRTRLKYYPCSLPDGMPE